MNLLVDKIWVDKRNWPLFIPKAFLDQQECVETDIKTCSQSKVLKPNHRSKSINNKQRLPKLKRIKKKNKQSKELPNLLNQINEMRKKEISNLKKYANPNITRKNSHSKYESGPLEMEPFLYKPNIFKPAAGLNSFLTNESCSYITAFSTFQTISKVLEVQGKPKREAIRILQRFALRVLKYRILRQHKLQIFIALHIQFLWRYRPKRRQLWKAVKHRNRILLQQWKKNADRMRRRTFHDILQPETNALLKIRSMLTREATSGKDFRLWLSYYRFFKIAKTAFSTCKNRYFQLKRILVPFKQMSLTLISVIGMSYAVSNRELIRDCFLGMARLTQDSKVHRLNLVVIFLNCAALQTYNSTTAAKLVKRSFLFVAIREIRLQHYFFCRWTTFTSRAKQRLCLAKNHDIFRRTLEYNQLKHGCQAIEHLGYGKMPFYFSKWYRGVQIVKSIRSKKNQVRRIHRTYTLKGALWYLCLNSSTNSRNRCNDKLVYMFLDKHLLSRHFSGWKLASNIIVKLKVIYRAAVLRDSFGLWKFACLIEYPIYTTVHNVMDSLCDIVHSENAYSTATKHYRKKWITISLSILIENRKQGDIEKKTYERIQQLVLSKYLKRWKSRIATFALKIYSANLIQIWYKCIKRRFRSRLHYLNQVMQRVAEKEHLNAAMQLLGVEVSKIQRCWRMFQIRLIENEDNRIEEENLITQAFKKKLRLDEDRRKVLALKSLALMKKKARRKEHSAVQIQKVFRSFRTRKFHHKIIEARNKQVASRVLQQWIKSIAHKRNLSIRRIQKWYRGIQTRFRVRLIRADNRIRQYRKERERKLFALLRPTLKTYFKIQVTINMLEMIGAFPSPDDSTKRVKRTLKIGMLRKHLEQLLVKSQESCLKKNSYFKKALFSTNVFALKVIRAVSKWDSSQAGKYEFCDLDPVSICSWKVRQHLLQLSDTIKNRMVVEKLEHVGQRLQAAILIQKHFRRKCVRTKYLRNRMRKILLSQNPIWIRLLENTNVIGRQDQLRYILMGSRIRKSISKVFQKPAVDTHHVVVRRTRNERSQVLAVKTRRNAVDVFTDFGPSALFHKSSFKKQFQFRGFWQNLIPIGHGEGTDFSADVFHQWPLSKKIGKLIKAFGQYQGNTMKGKFTLHFESGAKYVGLVNDFGVPIKNGMIKVPITACDWFVGRFDLQNVLNAPQVQISNYVKKRKRANKYLCWNLNSPFDLFESDELGEDTVEMPPVDTLLENTYEGEFNLNGEFHGSGTLKLFNDTIYIGQFINDQSSGLGEVLYSDGSSYQGEFLNSCRHGRGKYISGNTVFEGHWIRNKMNGVGKVWDGSTGYEGNFYDGLYHGRGVEIFNDGESKKRPGIWNTGVLMKYWTDLPISRIVTEEFIARLSVRDAGVGSAFDSEFAESVLKRYQARNHFELALRVPEGVDGENKQVQDIMQHLLDDATAQKILQCMDGYGKGSVTESNVVQNELSILRVQYQQKLADAYIVCCLKNTAAKNVSLLKVKIEHGKEAVHAAMNELAAAKSLIDRAIMSSLTSDAEKALKRLTYAHVVTLVQDTSYSPPAYLRTTVGLLMAIQLMNQQDSTACMKTLSWSKMDQQGNEEEWKDALQASFLDGEGNVTVDFLWNELGAIGWHWKQEYSCSNETKHMIRYSVESSYHKAFDSMKEIILDPMHDPHRVLVESGNGLRNEILYAIWLWIHGWFAACLLNEQLKPLHCQLKENRSLLQQDLAEFNNSRQKLTEANEDLAKCRSGVQQLVVEIVSLESKLHENQSIAELSARCTGFAAQMGYQMNIQQNSGYLSVGWTLEDLQAHSLQLKATESELEVVAKILAAKRSDLERHSTSIQQIAPVLQKLQSESDRCVANARDRLSHITYEGLLAVYNLRMNVPPQLLNVGRLVLVALENTSSPQWGQFRDVIATRAVNDDTAKWEIKVNENFLSQLLSLDFERIASHPGKAMYFASMLKHEEEVSKTGTSNKLATAVIESLSFWAHRVNEYCYLAQTINPMKRRNEQHKTASEELSRNILAVECDFNSLVDKRDYECKLVETINVHF